MINALGLLEVDGMVAAIDAADAMLKAANVRLLSHEVLDPGRLTLVVEGDLAACRAALDAGCAAAMRTGRVISRKEIGRPDDDTQWLVTGFNRQPKQPVMEPDAPVIVAESADELLALLTSVRQGMRQEKWLPTLAGRWKKPEMRSNSSFLPGRYVNAVVVIVSSPINLSEVPGVLQHPALTS